MITSGDSIYKMDYRKVLEYHKEKNADITVVYQKMTGKDLSKFGILQMDADNKLEASRKAGAAEIRCSLPGDLCYLQNAAHQSAESDYPRRQIQSGKGYYHPLYPYAENLRL